MKKYRVGVIGLGMGRAHIEGYRSHAACEVVAIAASDKFEVLGRTPLEETCHSTPAVAGGRLYVRTVKHLFSLGGKAEAAAP